MGMCSSDHTVKNEERKVKLNAANKNTKKRSFASVSSFAWAWLRVWDYGSLPLLSDFLLSSWVTFSTVY